jgi:alkaline phosphatase D
MLGSRPNYAIWDDHDYGPNDSGKNFRFKDFSRNLFINMWGNPSYGQKNEGIYTSFLWNDAEFFLMDDRFFRDADDLVELVDGKPNPEKEMYGKQQLDWFKTAIVASPATFRFIVTGSQVLNPNSDKDCLRHFPKEFNDMMAFLELNKVPGVLFLTGDKHHSEIIKLERKGTYALHDITASPLTSGVSNIMKTAEKDNPARMEGTLVAAQNFAKISINGPKNKRQIIIDFIDAKGERKGGTTIKESDLK